MLTVVPPEYYCRFLKQDREIYACNFHDLYFMSQNNHGAMVEEKWDWADVLNGEHPLSVLQALGDKPGRSLPSYELRLAKREIRRQAYHFRRLKEEHGSTVETRSFIVVDLTIVIDD